VKALAAQHLKEIDAKNQELNGMKATPKTLVHACRGDHSTDCPIIEDLASPEKRGRK